MPTSGDGAGGSVPALAGFAFRFALALLRGFLIVLAAFTDVESFGISPATTAGAERTPFGSATTLLNNASHSLPANGWPKRSDAAC